MFYYTKQVSEIPVCSEHVERISDVLIRLFVRWMCDEMVKDVRRLSAMTF